jgi:hypothetical protein
MAAWSPFGLALGAILDSMTLVWLRARLWRLRGFLDRLVGGVGLRRGRRDPARDRARRVATAWVTPAVAAVSSMPQAMSTALTSADQPVSTASAVRSNVEYATRPSSAPRAATEWERAAVVSAWTTSSLTPTRYTA